MKILVVMPYKEKLLRALDESVRLNLGYFILVGDKNIILEKCFKENIDSQQFIIYDFPKEIDAVEFCKDCLDTSKADFIMFGDIPTYYQTKILDEKDNYEIGEIEIIDLPFLKHFLFVSNNTKHLNCDFDDKKKSIIQADVLMKSLDIKKTNVAIISNMNNKTDILETNIIKMILKDNNFNNINLFDSFSISTLFSRINAVNIYNININLLIMRNYEASKIFIDTLNIFTNAKIANIIVSEQYYAIDTNLLRDYHNILFSIMILNKIAKNSKSVCYKKKYVI